MLLQGYSKTIRLLLVMFLTLTVSANAWGADETATLSFANKAQRTSFSTTKQVWEQNGVTFTNDKASSTNAVADYANPVRLYANSQIIVAHSSGKIKSIVFECNSSSYATALKNSIGSSASASSDKVTVTLDGTSNTFTVAKLTAQVRLDNITVTYTSGGSVTPDPCTAPTVAWNTKPANGEVGGSMTASVTTNYSNGLTYSSSNTTVATVTNAGVINYLAAGTTTITATVTGDGTTICEGPVSVQQEITVTAPAGGGGDDDADTWTLVKNVNDLAAGDQVVIAASSYNYALSTTQNSNNRGQAVVTKNGETITFGNDVQVLTLQTGNVNGTLAFYTGNGYLHAASSSSNYLRTETTPSPNSSWTITITNTGIATIKAQGTYTKNWLRYNSSSSIFSCYSSGQGDVSIYKKGGSGGGGSTPDPDPIPVTSVSLDKTSHTMNEGEIVTLTATVLPANADDPSVSWESDNEAVAKVNDNGDVTAVSPGNATITVTTTDGGHTATCTITVNALPTVEGTWTLVTDAANLKAGDRIVIAAAEYDLALSTTQNSNNRGQAAVTKDGSTITFTEATQILTLEAGTVDNTLAFNTGAGYLYAASSSSNQLKTQTTNNDNGSWNISIDNAGIATIVAQGSNTRSTMQYNKTSELFACYETASQQTIAIYKEGGSTSTYTITSTLSHVTANGENPTTITSEDTELELSYSADTDWNLPENITITIGDNELTDSEYVWDNENGDLLIQPTLGFTGNIVVTINGWQQLATPTGLNVTNITSSSATLSWSAVANANGYTVVVGSTSHNTNTTSITVENLTASTTYKWSVTAKGNGSTYTDSDAANGSDFKTESTAPTYYTVTLDPNYPVGKTGTFKDKEANTVSGNLEISLPANTESQEIKNLYSSISLEGYIFEGWYEAADGNAKRTNTGTITQDITFYAHWRVPYTVYFNAGTGTCTESMTETTANGITLPTATLEDCGDWTFLGWAETAIASETTTPPASILAEGSTYKPTANITLYAIYKRVDGGGNGEGTAATLTFDNTSKRTTLTTEQQVWTENNITLTNDKASSTSDIIDSSNPTRFYKNSKITVSAPETITKIVATTSGGDYTTALVNSVEGGGATSDGNTVTITPTASSNTYTVQLTGGQTRLYSITVTYGGGLSTSYYHSNPVCQTCENILTISKGTETNGTFTLDISGDIETCETEVSVVVKPTPANHYHIGSVTATTPTTGDAPTVTDNDNGTYTITYAANSTGASTINVTFDEDAKATVILSELGETTTYNSTYYVGEQYTLPATTEQSCEGKKLVGWSNVEVVETDTKPTENYYELGATVTLEAEQTFYAVFAAGSGGNGGETTVSVSINDYAETNSWKDATQYTTINISSDITATAKGESNTGKYYDNGKNWRLYQTETPTLTFTANEYKILSITITYTSDKTGILTFAGSNITSGTACAINATSATFGVGNTGSATNGQVRISNISVTYSGSGGGYTDYSTSCGTYTVTFYGFNSGGCTTTCGENPAEREVAQGATYTIPDCKPTFDPAGLGRTFAGTWNTQVDGKGTQYEPGESFIVDSDITLYAQWILKTTKDIVLPTDVEDLATTDIVVTGGTTLTLPAGTTTINSLTLEGGRTSDGYLTPAIYSDDEASVELTNKTIYFDLSVDMANYYPFAVPFSVEVSNVDYADPTLASASWYGTHYVIKRYDGANRANQGENKNANWVKVEDTETLQPGIGYIITAVPIGGEALIRFPMTPEQLWSSEGKTVDVAAYKGDAAQQHPRHAGWNFIANPYLSRFAGVNVGTEKNLLNGVLNYVNGEWQKTGEVPYVTIPAPDFSYYEQVELDNAILSPSYAFFVQAAQNATLSFATAGRQQNMPALRAAAVEPLRLPLTISQSTQSDRTTLLVSDDYTANYEIGKDLEKMFGSAEQVSLYAWSSNTPLAYCAVPWASAIQAIPLGYRTNKSGSVTIALDASADMSDAEMVLLYDAVTGMTTNLLINSYTFETEVGTHDARFTITITPKQGATTDCEEVMMPTDGTYKFLRNGQLYINHRGTVYTVEGRENSRVRQ